MLEVWREGGEMDAGLSVAGVREEEAMMEGGESRVVGLVMVMSDDPSRLLG